MVMKKITYKFARLQSLGRRLGECWDPELRKMFVEIEAKNAKLKDEMQSSGMNSGAKPKS